jgi:hypothetical protein
VLDQSEVDALSQIAFSQDGRVELAALGQSCVNLAGMGGFPVEFVEVAERLTKRRVRTFVSGIDTAADVCSASCSATRSGSARWRSSNG